MFEDDRPTKKAVHEIGCDLSLLSVAELDERIAVLQAEIARLESEKSAKSASRGAAEGLFSKK
ncbi:DUF1192 domain-containing protein [Pseudohoeflea coraliihabitans]|uniref:DUF1192 domain-containing protein n=1 Tax=Pseudohoeflea coraliihabitans TaxID=2860393 RepID=A0ABS6WK51_9HYPH|nr:DUF1192 domain-containing protein [Pseudohoeflea sp. DP4N28-3]MBW3096326.1 DUF1192 domain-containing protein [Pseudohoeflea sp. DP4N28-3]